MQKKYQLFKNRNDDLIILNGTILIKHMSMSMHKMIVFLNKSVFTLNVKIKI